jgi:hypothetical protein
VRARAGKVAGEDGPGEKSGRRKEREEEGGKGRRKGRGRNYIEIKPKKQT